MPGLDIARTVPLCDDWTMFPFGEQKRLTFPEELQEFFRVVIGIDWLFCWNVGTLPTTSGDQNAHC